MIIAVGCMAHLEKIERLGGVAEYVAQFVISAARNASITTSGIADLILSVKLECTN